MRIKPFLLVLGFCLLASAARADTMPDELLQKDYYNCMGGENPQQDIQRAQYCDCVRNGMHQWSVDQYAAIASSTDGGKITPDAVAALAKTCIAQALH